MSAQQIHPKVAAFAARIAEWLNENGETETGHGTYYVAHVSLGFDGETSGVSVIPDEFGGYAVRIEGNPS